MCTRTTFSITVAALLFACHVDELETNQLEAEVTSYPGYRAQPARPSQPFCEPGCGRGSDYRCWGTCPTSPSTPPPSSNWLPAGKNGALSITIDDNHAQDHAYWLALGQRTGVRFTWFVITGRVTDRPTNSNTGTWTDFAKLVSEGHELGSHSHSHNVAVADIAADVRRSQALLTQKLGVTAKTFAFPDPTRDVAGRWKPIIRAMNFVGTRGTYGRLVTTDQDAASYSEGRGLSISQLVAAKGWAVIHFHNLTDQHKATVERLLDEARRNNVWVAPFGTVAAAYPTSL